MVILMYKQYTREFLISEIFRFVDQYGKPPKRRDMCTKLGFPVYTHYYTEFGSWSNALRFAGLKVTNNYQYTDEELVNNLLQYYENNNKIPTVQDIKKSNNRISYYHYKNRYGSFITALEAAGLKPRFKYYTDQELIQILQNLYKTLGFTPTIEYIDTIDNLPSSTTFEAHFGNYNNALKEAGLPINKVNEVLTGNEVCSICGKGTLNNLWSIVDNKRVCNRCIQSPRNYVNGTLDPNSSTAIGIITEYIVRNVLNDCINYNTQTDFHNKFDLNSKKYGTIDVKSSKLGNYNSWKFTSNKHYHPNNYICIGFDASKNKILKVWIIPKNSNIIGKYAICISVNNLLRASQYEVDATPYNDAYQNLDIYSLPEFCNLKQEVIT